MRRGEWVGFMLHTVKLLKRNPVKENLTFGRICWLYMEHWINWSIVRNLRQDCSLHCFSCRGTPFLFFFILQKLGSRVAEGRLSHWRHQMWSSNGLRGQGNHQQLPWRQYLFTASRFTITPSHLWSLWRGSCGYNSEPFFFSLSKLPAFAGSTCINPR